MLEIYIGSDTYIELGPLTDSADDSVYTTLTITYTLTDSSGTELATDVSVPHVAAGIYRGIIDGALDLTANTRYWLEITGIDGSVNLFKRIPCQAVYDSE